MSGQQMEPARHWTAAELRNLPPEERDAILFAAVVRAEEESRGNSELTALKTSGKNSLHVDRCWLGDWLFDRLLERSLAREENATRHSAFLNRLSAQLAPAFGDRLSALLAMLRPKEQAVVRLRLEGYQNVEIADMLGLYERYIRRVLERFRNLAEGEGVSF